MQQFISSRLNLMLVFLSLTTLFVISATSNSVLTSYSPALRRYPYLTDAVSSYVTINWATDRSEVSGAVRYGKVGSEACTAHYIPATKTAISVNSVPQYQWKAVLNLAPDTQYCYRVYLGTSSTNEIDLLGSDATPSFRTQVPAGANQSFSFVVFGDWGMVDSSGTNSYQASLMSLIASRGARFAVTTGDNGYPDSNQKNLGDLVQTGLNTSAVFGPSFWKVPGASLPLFPILGNHGYYSPDTNHPQLITWPQIGPLSLREGDLSKKPIVVSLTACPNRIQVHGMRLMQGQPDFICSTRPGMKQTLVPPVNIRWIMTITGLREHLSINGCKRTWLLIRPF